MKDIWRWFSFSHFVLNHSFVDHKLFLSAQLAQHSFQSPSYVFDRSSRSVPEPQKSNADNPNDAACFVFNQLFFVFPIFLILLVKYLFKAFENLKIYSFRYPWDCPKYVVRSHWFLIWPFACQLLTHESWRNFDCKFFSLMLWGFSSSTKDGLTMIKKTKKEQTFFLVFEVISLLTFIIFIVDSQKFSVVSFQYPAFAEYFDQTLIDLDFDGSELVASFL